MQLALSWLAIFFLFLQQLSLTPFGAAACVTLSPLVTSYRFSELCYHAWCLAAKSDRSIAAGTYVVRVPIIKCIKIKWGIKDKCRETRRKDNSFWVSNLENSSWGVATLGDRDSLGTCVKNYLANTTRIRTYNNVHTPMCMLKPIIVS